MARMAVRVTDVTTLRVLLNTVSVLAAPASKLVPVMVTVVPAAPIAGVNPEIVGVPLSAVTVNGAELVTEPTGDVTVIVPVVAPAGTLVTICVGVDETTVAWVPLKRTVFCAGVVLNPVPEIVTVAPTAPLPTDTSTTEARVDARRVIERRFPTASYVYTAVSFAGSTTARSRPMAS
jgi:hypothetical protein